MMRTLLALAVFLLPASGEPKRILVQNLPPAEVRELQKTAPEGVTVVPVSTADLRSELATADGLIGALNAGLLKTAPRLKWVQTLSAGVERMPLAELRARGVTLTNARIVMGPNIADHALALLLTLTRQINRAQGGKAKQQWDRDGYQLVELSGKTAVIIGAGGIGMQIAQRAKGFGMKVIGVDPKDIPYTPLLDETVTPDRLDEVLPRADVVFVSAPHTPRSEHMMGPRQFDLMKQGAYFVAVSRGKLYDAGALVKALDSGRLAGAGLDVTDPEPLPPGHPLWQFQNTVITPHIAGHSDLMPARRLELFRENIRRFAAGSPLLNVVDLEKGY